MNKEANNDIDIMLRRLSRQDGNTFNPKQDGQHAAQEHLDADELNAYSENALPSALRARYTEHLTECTSCRKIVTQLSLASATVVPRKVDEARPSSLKTFLAALFSPLVFRYAIPAMAIVVVVAIAWIALRQPPLASDVAQNESRQEAPPAPAAGIMKGDNSANTEQLKGRVSEQQELRSRAGEKADASVDASPDNKQEAVAEEKKLAAASADASRDREDASKQNQPEPVAPAAPAPAAAPATGAGRTATVTVPKPDAVAERRVEVAQKKESDADKNKAMNEPQIQGGTFTSERPKKTPEAKAVPKASPTDTATNSRALRRDSRAKDETEAGEVRNVGGHRFRKQGQVWIDTLYSSQPTTNVSRGSEQYRALVADEPGIRSIAEQLNTEFIVVWKNRAYRIR